MPDPEAVQPRMPNIAHLIPDAHKAMLALAKAALHEQLPQQTTELARLRASQINGCSYCSELHARLLKDLGESDERIWAVAAWREAPYFTRPERAALALTEAVTRLADRPDPVPDEVWDEAARHYEQTALAALLIEIASINAWNRLQVSTRQVAGSGPRLAVRRPR